MTLPPVEGCVHRMSLCGVQLNGSARVNESGLLKRHCLLAVYAPTDRSCLEEKGESYQDLS